MNQSKRMTEFLFEIAYIVWIVGQVLKTTKFEEIFNVNLVAKCFTVISILLLFIKIIIDRYYSYNFILFLAVLSLILIVCMRAHNTSVLLMTFLFIFSAHNQSIERIIKISLCLHIIMMVLVVGSCLLGVLKQDYQLRNAVVKRFYMGYTYTTYLANYFFHVVLMYLFLVKEKISTVAIVVFLAINQIIFMFTDTRAVYFELLLLCFSLLFLRETKIDLSNYAFYNIMVKYLMSFLAIFMILASVFYQSGNVFMAFANKVLSSRLSLGFAAYQKYGISLLGQPIEWVVGRAGVERLERYLYVDSSYVNIAMNYGIILLFLLCVGYYLIGKKVIRQKDVYCGVVLIFLYLHSATDPQLIQLMYNPFLFLLSGFFAKAYKDKKENMSCQKLNQ